MLLALDTSTRIASVALHDGERLLSEATWHSQRQHTTELMPTVVRMLGQADVLADQLTAVAVALGPGSFTGLRVALSVAKGLALAHDLTMLGVPTLDVVSFPHRWQNRDVCALLRAGRGRACWALYGWRNALWQPLGPYAVTEVEQIALALERGQSETLVTGEIELTTSHLLKNRLGEVVQIVAPSEALRRAGHLAELGWARLRRGERDDPASLVPIYLHEPTPVSG